MTSGPISPSPVAPKPFQYSLGQLFVIISGICLVAGSFYCLGIWAIPVVGAIFACCLLFTGGSSRLKEAAVIAAIVGVIGALFAPAIAPVGRGPTPRGQCRSHMLQIGLALQNYHDVYGKFPPAYIADKSGQPMHSWRVLILPFMEEKNLYDAYRFDEPWDGPHNRQLHNKIVTCYGCPACRGKQPQTETNYLAVIGPRTMWPGAKSTTIADVADGTANTIMAVEVHNSGVHWMEPRDLHVTQMPPTINASRGTGISSLHYPGVNVVFVDGHTQLLKDDLPPNVLRGLLTIAGGEKVQAP